MITADLVNEKSRTPSPRSRKFRKTTKRLGNIVRDLANEGHKDYELVQMALKKLGKISDLDNDSTKSLAMLLTKCLGNMLKSLISIENWEEDDELGVLVETLHNFAKENDKLDPETFYLMTMEEILSIKTIFLQSRNNECVKNLMELMIPILPLESKSKLLQYENIVQMRHELQYAFFRVIFDEVQSTSLNLVVDRKNLLEDTFKQLASFKPYELRKQLKVKFQGEDGIDEGGLCKEFFQLITREIFDSAFGVFVENPESHLFWFNPLADESFDWQELRKKVFPVGQLFALAVYNSVLLDVKIPIALYKLLSEKKVDLDDLIQLNPELGNTLKNILNMTREEFEDAGMYEFTFEIDVTSINGSFKFLMSEEHEHVTWENRREFVQLYVESILDYTVPCSLQAFIDGFMTVFDSSVLFEYHPKEIDRLIRGDQEYAYAALREGTVYEGGYTAETPVIEWFWSLFLDEMTEVQRHKFLLFVSGTDRSPVGGLGKLSMRIARNGGDADRLPTAQTCFNILLLNEYSSKEKLRHWLFMAIEYSKGFGLL